MSTVDDALARSVYNHGYDPIDWAITVARMQIEAHGEVWAARAVRPDAFPLYSIANDPEAVARVIVGKLLDAGWTPPEVAPKVEVAA